MTESDDYHQSKLKNIQIFNEREIYSCQGENYQEALLNYDQASKIDAKNDLVWYKKGLILSKLERYQEALLSFQQAVDINY